MGKPKSEAEADFRRAASIFIQNVKLQKQLTLKQLGKMAGGVEHSTVQRWIKTHNRPDLVALEMIAETSGVPLPEDLPRLAREARRPPTAPMPTNDDVEAFLNSSPAWRRMVELGKALESEARPREKATLKRELEDLLKKVG